MVDLTLDSRRAAKATQTNNIISAMEIGINATKPFMMFQATVIRAFSSNLAMIADTIERGVERTR